MDRYRYTKMEIHEARVDEIKVW